MDTDDIAKYKEQLGEIAASLVLPEMRIGLGTGSTAACVIRSLGKRWQEEGLRFVGVPTSIASARLAESFGIRLTTLGDCPELDLAIDGADEVTQQGFQLIKGLGGALLREKIVRYAAKRFVVVVDERKMVDRLGANTPVPVEVTPFGWQATARHLERLGAVIRVRVKEDGKEFYLTDGNNMILDCDFGEIADPVTLQSQIKSIIGVIENGLFINCVDEVLVAGHNGVQHLKR